MGVFTIQKERNGIIIAEQKVWNSITDDGFVDAFSALLSGSGGVGDLYLGIGIFTIGSITEEYTGYRESKRPLWRRKAAVGRVVETRDLEFAAFTFPSQVDIADVRIIDEQDKTMAGRTLAKSDSLALGIFDEDDRALVHYTWNF